MQGINGDQIQDNTIPEEKLNFSINQYAFLEGVPPLSYVHLFNAVDNGIIVVNHGMKKRPAIRVEDSAGTYWIPKNIDYPTLDTAIVYFDYFFGGTVYCS